LFFGKKKVFRKQKKIGDREGGRSFDLASNNSKSTACSTPDSPPIQPPIYKKEKREKKNRFFGPQKVFSIVG
jgi:hypothetical protein